MINHGLQSKPESGYFAGITRARGFDDLVTEAKEAVLFSPGNLGGEPVEHAELLLRHPVERRDFAGRPVAVVDDRVFTRAPIPISRSISARPAQYSTSKSTELLNLFRRPYLGSDRSRPTDRALPPSPAPRGPYVWRRSGGGISATYYSSKLHIFDDAGRHPLAFKKKSVAQANPNPQNFECPSCGDSVQ